MEGETAPVPNVRAKLDELFLHWLSKATTQDFLQQELKRVLSREEAKTVASLSCGAPSTPAESLIPSPPPPPDVHCGASPSPPPVQSGRSQSSKKKRNLQLTLNSTKQVLTDANEQTANDAKADGSTTTTTTSTSSSSPIPPFYFPFGRPEEEGSAEGRDRVLKEAQKKFRGFGREGVRKEEFGTIAKVRL